MFIKEGSEFLSPAKDTLKTSMINCLNRLCVDNYVNKRVSEKRETFYSLTPRGKKVADRIASENKLWDNPITKYNILREMGKSGLAKRLVESRIQCLTIDVEIKGSPVSAKLRKKIREGLMWMLADVMVEGNMQLFKELVDKNKELVDHEKDNGFRLRFKFSREGIRRFQIEEKERRTNEPLLLKLPDPPTNLSSQYKLRKL